MKYIETTTWEKVFENWEAHEGKDPAWQKHAKERGWEDWASWRKFLAEKQLKMHERMWKIFEFTNPLKEIPDMLIGPFSSWQARVYEANQSSFKDLIRRPDQYEFFSKHGKVRDIRSNFPETALLIGLVRKDIGRIVCMEGSHRAVSFALAQKEGKETVLEQPVRIALANLPKKDVPLLTKALKRGSAKDPKIQ